MSLKDGVSKSTYVVVVADTSVALPAGNENVTGSRELSWLSERLVAAELRVTFHASATGDARLKIYQSMDDSNYDTESPTDLVGDIAVSAGNTCQKTFFFTIPSPYYQLVVENLDGTYDLTFEHLKVIEFPEME